MKLPDRVDLVRTVCGREIRFRTHQRPDLDEIYAMDLIVEHATPEFLAAYAKEGVILLGVDGGGFDEHAWEGKGRKAKCCATLVAKALGLMQDLVVSYLLPSVADSDCRKISDDENFVRPEVAMRDNSAWIKDLHRENPDQPEVAVRIGAMWIASQKKKRREFLEKTKAEFERCSSTVFVKVPGCRDLVVTTVRSDDELMNKFAHSKRGSRADVVIQRNSDGHTQIHSWLTEEFDREFFARKFGDLVGLLRVTEARDKGESVGRFGDDLKKDGTFEIVPEWHFMESGPMILNGSLKHRASVPPTRLSVEEIELAVIIALDVKVFESDHEEQCLKGICTSNGTSPCPWVNWRLYRCVAMRERHAVRVLRIFHSTVEAKEVLGKKGIEI